LGSTAPKHMSAAGAQNKLAVVYRDGVLYEPAGSQPSTHILKPDVVSRDYPSSVINEYLTMNLASRLKLRAPRVWRHYAPEPVYIVERFDRCIDAAGNTHRRHIIDACQLLNKSRNFKYRAATLQTLADVIQQSRNRASTRLRLYQWLVFNLLVANNDNHLKNLSFMVSAEGIELSPAYDLLSTGAYHTRALASERANWPAVELAIGLPDAATFGTVTRKSVLRAGELLGLGQNTSARELDRLVVALPGALNELVRTIVGENVGLPDSVRQYLAGEMRLFAVIQNIIAREMIERLARS